MDQSAGYNLKRDDEIAILPTLGAPASAVLEVAKIAYADAVHVQLQDGRIFSIHNGVGINTTGYITRVNYEHRKVLKMLVRDRVSCAPTVSDIAMWSGNCLSPALTAITASTS
jgi:hypothetical protein